MIIENTLKNAIGALEVEVSNVGMERSNLEAKKPSPQIARRLDALSQLESALEVSKDHLKILSRLIRDYDHSQARLADAQAELEDLKRQYRCAYCESVESRIADAQARAERAEAYINKMDGIIEEVGQVTASCINPYEDLKRALQGQKTRAEKAEARAERAEGREKALRGHLIKYADASYCDSLQQFRRTECLGWEAKVGMGLFGEAEMKAHQKANEAMGAHHGIYAALREFDALTLTPQGRTDGESGGQVCGLCDKPKPCKCLMELESDATAPEAKGGAA